MPIATDIEEVYQAIGEFVVFFQSVEDMYRQIGWFIVDPERSEWPPRLFRNESNAELVDKVTDLFVGITEQYRFPNGAQQAEQAERLRSTFHSLRRLRNRVLHSAYHEVIAGGQVQEIIRSNPKFTVDPRTGEIESDQETFDPDRIRKDVAGHAQAYLNLHDLRMQLIRWYPFTRFKCDDAGRLT